MGESGGVRCIRSGLGSGAFLFAASTAYAILPLLVFAARLDDEFNVVHETLVGLGLLQCVILHFSDCVQIVPQRGLW
jgi:hypothetical protein